MEVIPKNGGTLNDVAKKLFLRAAFRYLKEGGILAEENDSITRGTFHVKTPVEGSIILVRPP